MKRLCKRCKSAGPDPYFYVGLISKGGGKRSLTRIDSFQHPKSGTWHIIRSNPVLPFSVSLCGSVALDNKGQLAPQGYLHPFESENLNVLFNRLGFPIPPLADQAEPASVDTTEVTT